MVVDFGVEYPFEVAVNFAIGALIIGKGLGFLDLTYSNTVWIIL